MKHISSIEAIEFQIASEVRCNEYGEAFYSFRATSRLCGLGAATLSENLNPKEGDRTSPSRLVKYLAAHGFDGDRTSEWTKTGIPDEAVATIAEYYAFEAGKYCNAQSRAFCKVMLRVGVRVYSQRLTGWKASVDDIKAAVEQVLQKQLPEKATGWKCRYKQDFWDALENLYGLQRGQWACGAFISTYIYGYFPTEVQSRLEAINPLLENGSRANRHHQHFDDTLLALLQSHISNVTFLLQASKDKKSFKESMKKVKKFKFTEGNVKYLTGG